MNFSIPGEAPPASWSLGSLPCGSSSRTRPPMGWPRTQTSLQTMAGSVSRDRWYARNSIGAPGDLLALRRRARHRGRISRPVVLDLEAEELVDRALRLGVLRGGHHARARGELL